MNDLWLNSTKYDGSLHYRYPVKLVERSHERLVTYCEPGVPVESYRGSWSGKRHILSMFWRARPYVLHIEWDTPWLPAFLYVDIATGTEWLDGTLRYVDLDLDLILHHGSAGVHLDDADEFETNRLKWRYPEELVKGCWAAVEEVRALLEAGTGAFSPSMFAWRPGTPLSV